MSERRRPLPSVVSDLPTQCPILAPPKTRKPAIIAARAMAASTTSDRGKACLPKATYLQRIFQTCLGTEIPHRNPSGIMDKKTPSICVFCGSSSGVDARHTKAARQLGTLIGQRGFSLVFGGGGVGLMGEVADAVSENGGMVIGVLPKFLRHVEPPLKSIEELIITPDMQQRKARMLSLADAFVALSGGLGTLDEIFEVLSTAQLKVHSKPIVLLNIDGHFDPLIAVLDKIVRDGFAHGDISKLYRITATPEETVDLIEKALRPERSAAQIDLLVRPAEEPPKQRQT
jgi:uncharacterized protein (TIGR00730 family)